MSDLLLRTATALVLIAIALLALVAGGYVFAIFVAAAATLLYFEWTRLVDGWGLSWKIAGFFYALAPALALLWIRDRSDDGLALLLWVFVVTWAVDTGGYLVGRSLGRRKLAPSISPNKTWEGLAGGIVLATIAGAAIVLWFGLQRPLIVLAPVFGVAAQAGDLFESWMKRRSGAKDSGRLLPGHGGLFDRIDGLLPVAMLAFLAEIAGLA